MSLNDITVSRGDTFNRNIIITNSDGTPTNLTGWKIWFTVRKHPAQNTTISDSDAMISKEIYNLDNTGIATLNISSEDTDLEPTTYFYDIQYKDNIGNIKSSDIYKFIVKTDITRSR